MSGEIRETLSSDFENPDSYYTKLSWRCKMNTPCIVYPFNCLLRSNAVPVTE